MALMRSGGRGLGAGTVFGSLLVIGTFALALVAVSGVVEMTVRRELHSALVADCDVASAALVAGLAAARDRLAAAAGVAADVSPVRKLLTTVELDRPTVDDGAAELRRSTRWDLVVLVGVDGTVRGRSGGADDAAAAAAKGTWRSDRAVYFLAPAPVTFGSRVVGTLVAGERLSDEHVLEALRGTATQAIVFLGRDPIATSLAKESSLRANLATLADAGGGDLDLPGGERVVARSISLGEGGLRALVIRPTARTVALIAGLSENLLLTCLAALFLGLAAVAIAVRAFRGAAATGVGDGSAAERARTDTYRLVDLMTEAVALEVDGRLVHVNAAMARLLGWPSEDLVGQQLLEFVTADDRALVLALQSESVNLHQPPQLREIRWNGTAGDTIWAEVVAMRIDHGGRSALVTIARDVTALKLLQVRKHPDPAARG